MKKSYIIYSILASILFLSGCQEELDIAELTDFPPGILSTSPSGRIVQGDFELKIIFADGTTSPLSSTDVRIATAGGDEIASFSESLSGTIDSIVISGDQFGAASLSLGLYQLIISVEDNKSQVTEKTVDFEISSLPFPANNDEMYIAGGFNGWGWDQLELVADYTWEIQNIELDGGEWKFKNTQDWTDQDWGDEDCDGKMEITTGGGPNTNCSYSGLVNIRFNDETLTYTVLPAVTYAQNVSSLYLLGTFNDFEGEEYAFTQTDDNTWVLDEIRLKGGDAIKFAETGSFMGLNFGDNEPDSVADEFGKNIVLPNSVSDAFYTIIFNDITLAYEITFVRFPFPDNLYLVGGSTAADWDPSSSIKFVKTAEGQFETYAYLTVDGSGFKFLEVQDWVGDWGKGADGQLVQDGEDNLTVAVDGFYRIVTDFQTQTYSVTQVNWGIIGDATPGGWDPDTDMNFSGGKGDYTWTITVDLVAGMIKFRANDAWDINLGDDGPDGNLEYGGGDIAVAEAGNYTVQLILNPSGPYTYNITKN